MLGTNVGRRVSCFSSRYPPPSPPGGRRRRTRLAPMTAITRGCRYPRRRPATNHCRRCDGRRTERYRFYRTTPANQTAGRRRVDNLKWNSCGLTAAAAAAIRLRRWRSSRKPRLACTCVNVHITITMIITVGEVRRDRYARDRLRSTEVTLDIFKTAAGYFAAIVRPKKKNGGEKKTEAYRPLFFLSG